MLNGDRLENGKFDEHIRGQLLCAASEKFE